MLLWHHCHSTFVCVCVRVCVQRELRRHTDCFYNDHRPHITVLMSEIRRHTISERLFKN